MRPMEDKVILVFPRIDLGNATPNVAQIVVPCKLVLNKVVAGVFTPLANSASIRVDTIVANTRSNAAIGTVVMPDASVPGTSYYNNNNAGLVINAGTILSLECTEAGDSGEYAYVSLECMNEPETEANQSNLVQSS